MLYTLTMDVKFCTLWISLLVGLLLQSFTLADSKADEGPYRREYCAAEKFEPRCEKDEVVLIHNAVYGRMSAGRCITGGYTLGCHADVTNYISSRCTGRRNCSILVGVFESIAQPCEKDFKLFLEVTHQCVKVDIKGCGGGPMQTNIDVSQDGYLALSPSSLAVTGSICKWTFDADGGRKLRFRLLSDPISQQSVEGMEDSKRIYCDTKLTFHEDSNNNPVHLCRNVHTDSDTLYSSTSGSVQLTAQYKPTTALHKPYGYTLPPILLHYQVFGCHDITPPEGAMVRHSPQGVAVICNQTLETWWLTCKHDKWIGEFGNCSKGHSDVNPTLPSTRKELQSGIVLAVLVGVILGVVVGACMLCVIFVFRRSKRRPSRNRANGDELQYEPRSRSEDHTCDVSYPTLVHHEKSMLSSCDYEHMCTTYPVPFQTTGDGSQMLKLQLGQQHAQPEPDCTFNRTLVSPDRIKMSGYKTKPDGSPHIGNNDPMTYYDLEPQVCKQITRQDATHTILRDAS